MEEGKELVFVAVWMEIKIIESQEDLILLYMKQFFSCHNYAEMKGNYFGIIMSSLLLGFLDWQGYYEDFSIRL